MAGYPLFTPPDQASIKTVDTKNPHTITIGSLTSRRIVRLDPFIESFNFKVTKKTEFKKFDAVNAQGGVLEEPSELSMTITMNLPASSANAAARNKMKIQELQTMINPAIGKKNNTAVMIVHMKNLIARKPSDAASLTFLACKRYGLPCYVSNIDYTPDFEVGFFGKGIPKNIKLSLELKIINQKLNLSQDGSFEEYDYRFAQSFVANGMYQTMDNMGFPFGFCQYSSTESKVGTSIDSSVVQTFTPKQMSKLTSKSKTFIMFTNHLEEQNIERPKPDENALAALQQIYESFGEDIPPESMEPEQFADRLAAYENTKIARWVVFEPFINEVNRSVQVTHTAKQVGQGAFSTGYESTVPNYIKYSIDFDVVANDVESAKINLAKLNTLFRLSSAPTKEKFISRELMVLPERKTGFAKTIKVLIPGFIQAGSTNITKSETMDLTKRNALFDNCVDLHVYSVDFDIDDDIGFFEDAGYLFPKAYKVKMELYSTDTGIQNTAIVNARSTIDVDNDDDSAEPDTDTAPTEGEDDTPVGPTYTLTRVPTRGVTGPGGTDIPTNVHVYDVNGDETPDVIVVPGPDGTYISTFAPLPSNDSNFVPDPTVSEIISGLPTGVGIISTVSPGQSIQIYEPEDPGGNPTIEVTDTRKPSGIQFTTGKEPPPGGEPGGETGGGTDASTTDGANSNNDPTTAGGGNGYHGYDPDYAY